MAQLGIKSHGRGGKRKSRVHGHLNSQAEGSYIQKKKKKWAGPTGKEGPRQKAAAATGKKKKLQPLFGALLRSAAGPSHATRMHLPTYHLPTLLPDS